jgi:hypothetical protein
VARKKLTIRPPGLKPTTKVGTLGPYRGRLGLAWVIAPIVAGLVILVAGYFALFRYAIVRCLVKTAIPELIFTQVFKRRPSSKEN